MCSSMRIGLVATLLLQVACAGDPALHAEVADLKHRLDEAQRRSAGAEKKLEELEDRVFLLTDQIESQKVATNRREARLPVVTLRPPEPSAAADEGSDDIAYEGAARTPTPERVRPVLRMSGRHDGAEGRATPGASRSHVELGVARGENLGVAPAPTVPSALGERSLRAAEPPPPVADRASVSDRASVDPAPPARLSAAAERPALDSDPLKLYRSAYEDLRAGRHDDAARGFRDFVRKYPRHDYADNAQYWLGECFYDRKKYVEAATEFREVVTRYPNGNKAPDALLKLGFCLLSVGETRAGRDLLLQVPHAYPKTEAARLASERLADLRLKEDSK